MVQISSKNFRPDPDGQGCGMHRRPGGFIGEHPRLLGIWFQTQVAVNSEDQVETNPHALDLLCKELAIGTEPVIIVQEELNAMRCL